MEERGARAVRFDTDLFPSRLRLSVDDRGDGPSFVLEGIGEPVHGEDVVAVWTRSFWPPLMDDELDPRHRQSCITQSQDLLDGFWSGLRPDRWVSHPAAVRLGANKVRQHEVARRVGLTLPKTLITNDPERVRSFLDDLDGPAVTKLLKPLVMSMGRAAGAMYTHEIDVADLEHLDGLHHAPMIFQEKIEKDVELRVKYVDGRLFTGLIDSTATETGRVDWRLSDASGPRAVGWQPGDVPEPVAEGLRRLMAELDLVAGAIDLIRTPAGEHVFLEVNPLGEWGMLERDLDLPISRAIAEALIPS